MPSHPLSQFLYAKRVGGTFWGSAPVLPGGPVTLVIPAPGRIGNWCAWAMRVGASAPVLLVSGLHGDGRGTGPIVTRDTDPHSLLDRVVELLLMPGAPLCDVSVLALLRGIKVRRGGADFEEHPGHALALLLHGTTYHDPFNGSDIDAPAAAELLAEWRERIKHNRGVSVLVGMAWWKKRRIADLFAHADPAQRVSFRKHTGAAVRAAAHRGGAIAVWSSRVPDRLFERASDAGVPVLRVEDGFIRSLGLGSGLLPPASIVLDKQGLYLDPSQQSDLELILECYPFDALLRARAAALVHRLVQNKISKYGAAPEGGEATIGASLGRRVVLVPGQVSDDLSVRLGGGGIGGALDLLRSVREAEPSAWIIFRPHPDVDAGFRRGGVMDSDALRFANQISRGGSITNLLDQADAVHTLTSLAGFEAILRGVEVTCWGQPFYAGWGLTIDKAPVPRRTRRLTREDLAAGCLLIYPRYIDPLTRLPCGPEVVIDRLLDPSLWRPSLAMRLRSRQGALVAHLRRLASRLAND